MQLHVHCEQSPTVKCNTRLQYSCVLCKYRATYSYSTILYSNETESKNRIPLYVSVTSQLDRYFQMHDTTENRHQLSALIRGSKFFTTLATICASRSSFGQILHKSDLQRNKIRTLLYARYFASKTRSS